MGKLLCEKKLRDVWCRNESVRAEIGQILQTHTHTHASKLVVEIYIYNWIACGVCSIIVWFADNVPPSLYSTSACAVQSNKGILRRTIPILRPVTFLVALDLVLVEPRTGRCVTAAYESRAR